MRFVQGGRVDYHNTPHSIRTVPNRLSTFHNLNFRRYIGINFRGMFDSPLLSFLSYTIIKNRNSLAMQTLDNGLEDRWPRHDGAYPWNPLCKFSKRFAFIGL